MGDPVRSTSGTIIQGEFLENLKRSNVVYVPVFFDTGYAKNIFVKSVLYRQTINTSAGQTCRTKPVKAESALKSSPRNFKGAFPSNSDPQRLSEAIAEALNHPTADVKDKIS